MKDILLRWSNSVFVSFKISEEYLSITSNQKVYICLILYKQPCYV